MASVTYYVVQAFDEDDEGNLIPRQAQQAPSAAGPLPIPSSDPSLGLGWTRRRTE
jgi:hypothetical protein